MQTDSFNIHGDHGIHDGQQVEWQKERIGHLEMALAHLLLSYTLIQKAETMSNAARDVLNGGQWIIPPESGTIPLHKESLDRYEYLEWKAKQHGLLLKRAVEERASQICREKAQKIGPEEFKRSMTPLIIFGISEQASIDMDEHLIAALVAFRKQYKITSCMICGAKNGEPCDAGLHG